MKRLGIIILLLLAFLLGYDDALTRMANDMHFGRMTLRDNRLVLEIRARRILLGRLSK